MDGNLKDTIKRLIVCRKENGLHARSEVKILLASADVYAACVDEKVYLKLGPGDHSPSWEGGYLGRAWELVCSGEGFAVWQIAEKR